MSSSKHPLPNYGLDYPPAKKPRFSVRNPSALVTDDADDDELPNAELEADVIGSNRPQHRRGAVNIDGFDSDSDGGGNFDERAAEKAKMSRKTAESKDEDEADMFADLEDDFKDGDDDEKEGGKKTKKNDIQFLSVDQIEGQVKNSKAGGHVGNRLKLTEQEARYMDQHGRLPASAEGNDDASSSESDADDEIRAAIDEEIDEELGAGAKMRHAPRLDAFNMRDEHDEGRFDESGNYVRKAIDPDSVHDRWLEGTSKKDMKKAREAMEKREEDRRKRDREDDARSVSDVLKDLISRMEKGETVLEALARLGKAKDKKRSSWKEKQRRRKAKLDGNGDIETAEHEAEVRRREDVETLTAAADLMLTRGMLDIYDAERELLARQYSRQTGEQWQDSAEENQEDQMKMWEYRWTDARDGGQTNGPYDNLTMRHWNDAGYFGEGIEFRPVGEDTWSRIASFL